MDSGEQLGISFEGTLKKFGNKRDCRNFSMEHGNTDAPGGLIVKNNPTPFLISGGAARGPELVPVFAD